MFANTQMMGMDMGFPDVCLTPAVPSPIPIPYPNIAMGPTASPSQTKVLVLSGVVDAVPSSRTSASDRSSSSSQVSSQNRPPSQDLSASASEDGES